MTKSDLKAGYVIETRSHKMYICVQCERGLTLNSSNGSFSDLRSFNENLMCQNPDFDVIRVYGFCETQMCANIVSSRNRPILWERKEEIKYMNEADILKATIEVNGDDAQLFVAMEECAELIQAISKYKRYDTGETLENLAEEIADVLIVIDEIKQICNITDEHIKSYHDKKIDRLKERLKVK